jgi:hypothetical protein
MSDYCWAHTLVSEPSDISQPNVGLAADCHMPCMHVDFPQFTLFFRTWLPKKAAFDSDPLYH